MSRRIAQRPRAPGEILYQEFMVPHELTAEQLAEEIGSPIYSVRALIEGRRRLDVDMAVRLSKRFATDLTLWTNLQNAVDVWDAAHAEEDSAQP